MKILILEDNARVSGLMKRGLESQEYQVYISEDAEDALVLLEKIKFDLIVTDIMLPGIDGISFTKKVRTKNKEIPIIMLTALGTIDEKLDGFDAGADDYMVKPFEIRELYARIKALLLRKNGNTEIIEKKELVYDALRILEDTKTVYRDHLQIDLTPKEFSLLHFLVSNAEKVLSKDEIAENVWGNNFDTGTNYIDVYIAYLRKKIDKDFGKKLIHTKSGMGFILTNKL
ncbi:response regulator transcription factor [Cloacibacterium sp.]|uniref:response regulator transcription factor n=1 Tax=Cloacibacterium sp. TaxID=1913682 RepID=UPI0039E6FB14